jgi:hypothetical protein
MGGTGLRWAPALSVLAFCPAAAQADEDARPSVKAVRARQAPQVDGNLDEAAWAGVPRVCGFRQREPRESAPATEDTCVAVSYDDANLYVAVQAHDRQPALVIARIRHRDRVIEADEDGYDWGDDDAVAVALDTFHDRRNAFVFATNAEGAEFDALVADESPILNDEWRTAWTVRAARSPGGWAAELAIPWRSLRYPPGAGPHRFGFDVFRVLRRRHEESALSGWRRGEGGLHRVSAFATLDGFEDLPRPPLNLELLPFASLQARQGWTWSLGLDSKWEVGPGLVLDGTIRPDFAQVELDPLELSLDPYPLLFPEKRPFFLESAGIFDLGTRGREGDEAPPFLMFTSRSIGYGEDGPSLVHGGLRFTGRWGHDVVGLLDVVADGPDGGPTNHAVLRYQRTIGSGHLGLMLTDVRGAGGGQTGLALDGALWPLATLRVSGFYARSALGPLGSFAGDAHHLAADYDDGTTSASLEVLGVGEEARPALGFVARPGIRRFSAGAGRVLRPGLLGLREIQLDAALAHVTRPELSALDLQAAGEVTFLWEGGAHFGLFAGAGFETALEPWRAAGVVPARAGRFPARSWGAGGGTNPAAALVGGAWAHRRQAYGGHFDQAGLELRARLGRLCSLAAGSEANRIVLDGGRLTYLTSAARLELAPSTRLVFGVLLQHRTFDRRLAAQARLVVTYLPASDLVIVVGEERGDDRPTVHGLDLKISLLGRL